MYFPNKGPGMQSFDVIFDISLDKLLNKQKKPVEWDAIMLIYDITLIPADAWSDDNVIIASKRRRNVVFTK